MKGKKKNRFKGLSAGKIRSSIVMALICVLMLSGATYAWFTLGNTARVNSLSLQVTSEGNLYVAKEQSGISQKLTEISIASGASQILYPCTTEANGTTMLSPVYATDNEVSGTKQIAEADKEKYYYETDIYLEVEEALAVNSSPNTYDITLGKNSNNNDGTYVNSQASNSAEQHPERCVRISFILDDGTVAVYEPNSNVSNTGDMATNSTGKGYTGTHKQEAGGAFAGESGTIYYTGDSSALFQLKGNTPTKVKVRVWFEGTDNDCRNSIQEAQIVSQLKFISHKVGD
ncbi:MAG: hypothetical protein IJ567_06720 [Lachnospiraceae bacterium]|nr:hypothetical protein [Lachnospiraceae bacterium]